MDAKLFVSMLLCAVTIDAAAQDSRATAQTTLPPMRWNTSTSHWDRILATRPILPELQIGKTDLALSGPLVRVFRAERRSSDLTAFQKFLRLPIVNQLTPQRMPAPAESRSRYFAWGDSGRDWASIAQQSRADSAFAPMYHEPTSVLLLLGPAQK